MVILDPKREVINYQKLQYKTCYICIYALDGRKVYYGNIFSIYNDRIFFSQVFRFLNHGEQYNIISILISNIVWIEVEEI